MKTVNSVPHGDAYRIPSAHIHGIDRRDILEQERMRRVFRS